MTGTGGLRERKKAAARAALSRAAWALLLESGLDAVTPEAVAEAAQMSPRTFRNYFSSRDEALVDELAQQFLALVEEIRARPADEAVWDSLVAVLPSAIPAIVGDRVRLGVLMQVVADNVALKAQLLLATEHMSAVLARLVAQRTGTDGDRDIGPLLLAETVGAALGTAVSFWGRTDTDVALSDLVRDCLAQVRAGLPVGAAVPDGIPSTA